VATGETEFGGTERFEILRRLGSGGMGVVYEARDRLRDRRVALKTVLHLHGPDLGRLRAEFRALQGLRHPNLVTLDELHDEEGSCFYTMELIEGIGFVSWVRPPAPGSAAGVLDEQRLRPALAQLCRGLLALHDAGRVHRDIKPSNILVTSAGRVVLLDFGLATVLTGGPDQSLPGQPVGTVEYMAPEQAAAAHVGAEADWYGVGVVLYEALTGCLPYSGAPLEVMANKQQLDAKPPHELWPDVPADLDALCLELLRFDPAARPRGRRILARLGAAEPGEVDDPTSTSSHAQVFVGRERELGLLRRCVADVRRGAVMAVLVHGESGVGKTTLCRRFAADLLAAGDPPVVLRGRCFDRRAVPFRGLEGVMEALGRHLSQLSADVVERLLPQSAGLLAEVFPALRRVKAVAQTPRPPAEVDVDPHELRARMFAAARELVGRVAASTSLVVIIDDLQWADPDSLALLTEILRPPDAPRLLLVATLRSGTEFVGTWGAPDVGPYLPGDLRRVRVDPLPPDEGRELVAALAHRFKAGQVDADQICAESRGVPLLIEELVRLAAAGGGLPSALRAEEIIRTRAARLPGPARRILDLLALAGAPVPQDAVSRAASMDPAELERWLGRLRVGGFAVLTGARGDDQVCVGHERIREAVLGCLEQEARVIGARELALALEASGTAMPELLAVQWRLAGDRARAALHAAAGAERGRAAFAFDHAAFHYRLALDLGIPPEPRELRVKLGDALAHGGRGLEAAEAYLEAAEDAPPFEAIELRSRAASQYLLGGAVDAGVGVARDLAASLGMPFATTPRQALAGLVLRRVRVRLRGLGHQRRHARQIAPEELARLDAAHALATGLSNVDTIRSTDLQSRALLMALRVGEPGRVARALAAEAGFVGLAGVSAGRRAHKLLAEADALARQCDDRALRAQLLLSRGTVDYWSGRFASCREHLQEAEPQLREHCSRRAWELGMTLLFSQFALAYLGRVAEMSRRVPLLAAEAIDRGDLYTATNLRLSILNTAWLVDDSVDEARRVAQEASGRWGRERFNTQHWYDLMAQVQLGLYTGEAATAHALVDEQWDGLQGSLLLRVQVVRIEALLLRARCALAAVGEMREPRPGLLEQAERDAQRARRERTPWGDALADLALAGVAAARGDDATARARLEAATVGFEAADMELHAAVARRRRGELLGGDAGRALVESADAWLRGQRIVSLERWLAMIAPGFGRRGGAGA
jgi:hypothetical protein